MPPALFAVANVSPHPVMLLPFALLLLAVALMPFTHQHWWERHYYKVSVALGIITTIYYVFILQKPGRILHAGHEYASFIALVGSLFIVSGGIHVDVRGEAKPRINCLFLLIGAILANIIGTTGASMLLIRPWIRMNKYRITAFHIVFFIFVVSNVGGCLTPIGDPPLFLGYLKGVPFWWVLQRCWEAWAFAVAVLIGIFWLFDRQNFLRAPPVVREKETRREIWTIQGWRNLGFLSLILTALFIKHPAGLRQALMLGAAVGSWFATPPHIHQANGFDLHPIREVAWIFLGIFATVVPAIDYLEFHAASLGIDSEMKFFWSTGVLSAALDNAPTYLTFMAVAMGRHHMSLNERTDVVAFVDHFDHHLIAISLGAVFFGAMTYIGNGPNFMVKAISQRAKVETPGFFVYLLKYAIPILLPLFALISILFFSPWRWF